MSKFDERLATYTEALGKSTKKTAMDPNLLKAVTKGLGPSIYLRDASLVSCTDEAELNRVKKNFLIKKLGMADSPALDKAIREVCQEYDANPRYRAVFYYMLVKKLNKESAFI